MLSRLAPSRRFLLAPVAALSVALLGIAYAQDQNPPSPSQHREAGEAGEHGPGPRGPNGQRGERGPAGERGEGLEAAMKAIGRDFKTISRQASDSSKNESTLAALVDMEQQSVLAKRSTPPAASTRPATEKPEYLADYRRMMNSLLREELDLEDNLLDGKNDKAAASIKTMKDLMDEGHSEFRPKRH